MSIAHGYGIHGFYPMVILKQQLPDIHFQVGIQRGQRLCSVEVDFGSWKKSTVSLQVCCLCWYFWLCFHEIIWECILRRMFWWDLYQQQLWCIWPGGWNCGVKKTKKETSWFLWQGFWSVLLLCCTMNTNHIHLIICRMDHFWLILLKCGEMHMKESDLLHPLSSAGYWKKDN